MPRGRPTKLTPQVQQTIVNALSAGNYFEVACEYAGISAVLGCEWMARGRGDDPDRPQTPLYAEFAEAVRRAQAEDEVHTIARLKKAGQGGELIEETTYQEPSVIVRKANGDIEERIGKKRTVRRYSAPEPSADEWRMERKHMQRWGRKDRVDISVQIEQAAEKVAHEFDMTAQDVLEEVKLFMLEERHAG